MLQVMTPVDYHSMGRRDQLYATGQIVSVTATGNDSYMASGASIPAGLPVPAVMPELVVEGAFSPDEPFPTPES